MALRLKSMNLEFGTEPALLPKRAVKDKACFIRAV